MTIIKSGDRVVLKSGGPVMTIDTVNTDIFDDEKVTGVLCVWFEGEKLQRVRFDHRAIEPATEEKAVSRAAPAPDTSVEYKAVLDDMADAMNLAEAEKPVAAAPRKPKRAKAAKTDDVAAVSGVSRTH